MLGGKRPEERRERICWRGAAGRYGRPERGRGGLAGRLLLGDCEDIGPEAEDLIGERRICRGGRGGVAEHSVGAAAGEAFLMSRINHCVAHLGCVADLGHGARAGSCAIGHRIARLSTAHADDPNPSAAAQQGRIRQEMIKKAHLQPQGIAAGATLERSGAAASRGPRAEPGFPIPATAANGGRASLCAMLPPGAPQPRNMRNKIHGREPPPYNKRDACSAGSSLQVPE
jgi:hypothetical protein